MWISAIGKKHAQTKAAGRERERERERERFTCDAIHKRQWIVRDPQ